MDYQWLKDQQWQIRENQEVAGLLEIGDILTLSPNTSSGTPQFFVVHYTGKYSFWDGRIFYPVGVNAPKVNLTSNWDDDQPASNQAKGVRDFYTGVANNLRSHANDPMMARLLGYIFIDPQFAIVNLFCFQSVQPNGHHWFAIDSQWNHISTMQDGTAHGDPPK
jgi:hypothetical protein